MALAGEAAVRIVPSLRGFHGEVKRKLEAKRIDFDVNVQADTRPFNRQMAAARAWQEANPVTIPVRTDWNGLKKDLSQVEHIFQRNNLVKGIRLNIKILGLDALPALAYAAGSAASGLDALAKSAFIVPGALSGVGAAAASLAIGLGGVGDAFKDYGKAAEDSSKNLKEVRDAQRDLARAQRDVSGAIRDQRRELEDLNAELRRSTLDEADAILNLQESADRLKQGGFKTITEYQRAQLRFLRDVEGLKEVRKNNIRLLEDTNEANAKGIAQGDQVVSAIDKVVSAVDRLNEAQKKNDGFESALGKLSPNARKFVETAYGMKGAWEDLRMSVQDNLFAGLDQSLAQLGTKVLPGLKIGMSQIAGGLNSNIKAVVDSVSTQKNGDLWSRIFGNTTTGLENFKNSLDPIITGFSRMADVGATFLPRLGTAFEVVGKKFDAWTAKISADGTLARWIDQGLDAVTSLGNIAKNVGSVISSVGEAFNVASGTEGGFIGSLDRGLRSLADYLKGDGRTALIDYFTKARDLIQTVGKAFGDMRPLIKSVVDAARTFSTVLLPALGFLAKTAQWIEEHTSLLTKMFYVYATWRTIAPIIDGVSGAWKNYKKVMSAGAAYGPTADWFAKHNSGLVQMKSNLKAVGGVAAGASSQIKQYTGHVGAAAQSAANLISPTNNAASQLNLLGNKAKYAGQRVGSAGSVGSTLLGALGGLARFIGPAIGAGVLGIALAAGLEGLNRMGRAHDQAKDAANRQKEALSQLKSAMDQVTGAAGAASLNTAAQIAQAFEMGPAAGGKRNVLDDVKRAGIASPDQLLAATLPQKQQAADAIEQKVIDQATAKIAASDSYTKYKDQWDKAGVTPEVLARAQIGQPDALAKIDEAERNIWGKARREFNWLDRRQFTNADKELPSISDTIVSAGTFEEASVGSFLRGTRERNVNDSNLIKQATQAAGGTGTLKQAGQDAFGKFGATNSEVYVGADGIGYLVVPNDPGEIDPEIGQVERKNDSQWQITLSKDATDKFINVQRYAGGGLIGGIGSGTSDSNMLMASRGEFITRKAAVDHYGAAFFQSLNNMELPAFAPGGEVPPPVIPWQQQAQQTLGAAGLIPAPSSLPTPPSMGLGSVNATAVNDAAAANMGVPPAVTLTEPTIPVRPAPAPPAPPAAPAPAPKPATPATPSGVGATQPGIGGGYSYSLLNMAQKTGVAPSVLSKMLGMGGSSAPYAGLPIGTDIKYGGAGFPDWVYAIGERFGLQASTYAGHQEGSGSNKGIDWSGPPDKMRAFAQYLTQAGIPGLEQVIYMDPRDGAKFGLDPGDRGKDQTIEDYYRDNWAGHTDHVHTRMSASIPAPEAMMAMMGAANAAGLPLGNIFGGGMPMVTGGGGGKRRGNGAQNLIDYFTNQEWLQPENVTEFLAGTAQNVGSSLLDIGLGLVSGFTGLDFSSLVGAGQQIGNFYLGAGGGGGGGDEYSGDFTELNGMASADIERYLNGDLSLGNSGGLDALLGSDISSLLGGGGISDLLGGDVGASFTPGGGAEQWRPVVRRVLEMYGPQLNITNLKAWEDAIVKQIDTESKGDPGAENPNDSNGKGGTQSVNGLLQFLPETFAANNITGGDYMDPVAQIAAVLPYVINKYGMDANGAPNQIGRGVGYARGGRIKGIGGPRADKNLIRVSRGEFLNNANAVNHYGPDFFARLNNREIPKNALPGFADGMWWNPLQPAPAPAPQSAGPAPAPPAPPPPSAAPAGGQSAGPLPLAAPAADAAPSTGGAPGPGATAPAPDPGALPQVADAMAGIGSGIGGDMGLAQPGAAADPGADPRAALGAAPTSQDHNSPVVAGGIRGAASAIGSIMNSAIQAGAMGATMGGSAVAGGMGAGQAGQMAQAGAQIAGEVAVGAVNILSSLLVGTATNGSTQSASGVPLLPQRSPMQTGVPQMGEQYTDNRTYNLTNLDEYRRLQERDAAQQANPWIGKF